MATIQWGGETYREITIEQYDQLTAALDRNRKARMVAVEEFRVWCEANKGVHTVEEGLRACTPEELYQQASHLYPVCVIYLLNVLGEIKNRLEQREAQRQREIAAAQVELVTPKEVSQWP